MQIADGQYAGEYNGVDLAAAQTAFNSVQADLQESFVIGEVYYFLRSEPPEGFVPADGRTVSLADYPEAARFFATPEGQAMCISEAEWQSRHNAVYYTSADGVSESWGGVGGVARYALNGNTLRVPDLRGMYQEAAGLDGLTVGAVHADRIRNMTGTFNADWSTTPAYAVPPTGIFEPYGMTSPSGIGQLMVDNNGDYIVRMNPSRVVPTGSRNAPRAYGTRACVYLGK